MTKIETATNIATLAVCGAICAVVITPMAMRAFAPKPVRPGQRISSIAASHFQGAERTLLVVAQTSCRFCAESLPFYEKLSNLAESPEHRGRFKIIMLMLDDPATARSYVEATKLRVAEVMDVPPGDRPPFFVSSTPTLILVDPKGTIRNMWVGKLGKRAEADVLEKLQVDSRRSSGNN